jgi:tetratricopeptide (TPR) repeat protein
MDSNILISTRQKINNKIDMKTTTICIIILLLFTNCSEAQKPDNTKPHYGDIKKTQEYIDLDNEFIQDATKQFGSRKAAAKQHVSFGWDYIRKGDFSTAMKRFNQAWLLDSTLIDVDWGYGAVLGATHQYENSIYYLKKYADYNMENPRILIDLGTAYLTYANSLMEHGQNKSSELNIRKGKSCLLKYISLDDKSAFAYNQLAAAYYFENKMDSAKYYGRIAERLDPKVLSPEFKKIIKN